MNAFLTYLKLAALCTTSLSIVAFVMWVAFRVPAKLPGGPVSNVVDSGSSSTLWLDAGDLTLTSTGSSPYVLRAYTKGDLIFAIDSRTVLRFQPDGGAEVDGKPAPDRRSVCAGFDEWLRAEGYGGMP